MEKLPFSNLRSSKLHLQHLLVGRLEEYRRKQHRSWLHLHAAVFTLLYTVKERVYAVTAVLLTASFSAYASSIWLILMDRVTGISMLLIFSLWLTVFVFCWCWYW